MCSEMKNDIMHASHEGDHSEKSRGAWEEKQRKNIEMSVAFICLWFLLCDAC
jgi:hypothetical protein